MELEDFLEDVEMEVYCTAYNVIVSRTIDKGTHCTHLFYIVQQFFDTSLYFYYPWIDKTDGWCKTRQLPIWAIFSGCSLK